MSAGPETKIAANVLEAVRALAAEELDYRGPLVLESRLIEDLDLDSIRLLTLAVAVEDHFGICLDEEEDASLHTVGDLVALVRAKTTVDGPPEDGTTLPHEAERG